MLKYLGQWGSSKMRLGDVQRAGSLLVPRPLFQSSQLTESLEQAKISIKMIFFKLNHDQLLEWKTTFPVWNLYLAINVTYQFSCC